MLLLLALMGCTGLPFQLGSQLARQSVTPETGMVPSSTVTPTAEPGIALMTPGATAETTQTAEVSFLRLWLPPEFDPEAGHPASLLLKARLQEFLSANPDIRLDVRVKAEEGPGGILEALVAANAAAPLALPDLVLLPRPLLESAALKGLLHPYDKQSTWLDDPGWFEYARQLAYIKDSIYAMPFAGDAMALAYHPALIEIAPPDLETALSSGMVLLFPATEAQALFTLCLYLAEGASLQDIEGRPAVNETTLRHILEFYQRAGLAGVMPYWLTQYSNDGQIWETFTGQTAPMAVTWASAYLQHELTGQEDLAIAPLPTLNGTPFTLATGWGWALAGHDPARSEKAASLAEFLAEEDFLAQWSQAAGYLPPRTGALRTWQGVEWQQAVERISSSARMMPSAEMVSSLGPALEKAVVDVLKSQNDPQSAAQAVIEQINQP